MSGRPARNCKRRSASEMLGKKSPGSTPSKAAKKAKEELPTTMESTDAVVQKTTAKVSSPTKQSPKPATRGRGRPRKQTIETTKKDDLEVPAESSVLMDPQENVVESNEEPLTEEPASAPEHTDATESLPLQSQPEEPTPVYTETIETVPETSETVETKPVQSETVEVMPVQSETVNALDSDLTASTNVVEMASEEMESSTVESEDSPVKPAQVDKLPTPADVILQTSVVQKTSPRALVNCEATLRGHSIVARKVDVVEVQESQVETVPEGAEAPLLVMDTTSEEPCALAVSTLPDDALTLMDDGKERNTLPERTEAIDESDLLALPEEEVVLTERYPVAEKIPLPKKKMVITSNARTKQPVIEELGNKKVKSLSTLDAMSSLEPEAVIPQSVTAEPVNEPPPKLPVTKTYIVGKNNCIQEVIMGQDDSTDEMLSNDGVDNRKIQAGDTDDEECEYEEEEERIKQEGLDDDEPVMFCDRLLDGYTVDDLVMAVFQKVKPKQLFEDHSTEGTELRYKCNHCWTETGVALESDSRMDMVRHIKDTHVSDYAPWQCPICLFRCIYPGSLLLHMSMHTKNKPFECDRCNKKFAYKQKLLLHYKHHDDTPNKQCDACKEEHGKTVLFYEDSALQGHVERRHTPPVKQIYEGDNKAIIQETGNESTSLNDALQLLAGTDQTGGVGGKGNRLYSVERGSIKISDMGEIVQIPHNIVTATSEGAGDSNQQMSVVSAHSDMIGNPNSVVQIMPVSFRNESGIPETINVVITVPPNEGVKLPAGAALSTKPGEWEDGSKVPLEAINATDWQTKAKMNSVDKELLNHCVVLSQPIHYRNQRAFIKCTECPKGMEVHFGSVTQFCEHLRKDHADKDIKPYKCSQCNYRCRVKGNLDQHIKFHSTERPFTCHICGKGFIQKYKLNLHLKFHENRREWRCDVCGSAFNDKQDLSRHKKNVHFNREEGVPCPHCPRVFKNEYMLSQHVHVHTGERNYKCSICEKSYSTRESLRSHMKGHQFQFGCEICAKPLGSYSAFIAHKRLHDPNQSGYPCEHCGKVLLFKATLEAHIRSVHSDVKDFKCEQCDKGFKTQAQLNNHMISHTKDKPYQCKICGYAVKRKDSLRQHMYRHAEVKPYRCGRCGKEYTQKQALEIHLKSKHAGVTTFNCTMCERGFNTNYLLKKHMHKAHEVELVSKVPKSDQVIIAQQEIDEAAESEPPAPGEAGVLPPAAKKQTVLINAHICEHCHEVFVSQHALAVHILSDHMSQNRVNTEEDAGNIPTNAEDGQVVNISETVEIPIGEEMVLVQSVEPGVLSTALEKGATLVPNKTSPSTSTAAKACTVSLLPAGNAKSSADSIDELGHHIVVTDATIEEQPAEAAGEELRIIKVSGGEEGESTMDVIEASSSDSKEAGETEESVLEMSSGGVEEEVTTSEVVCKSE